jgi:hypothetical protein
MLGEALSALASAGGTALVGAMVSDGWEGLRARFARLLGHGDATEIASAGVRLEEARVVLAELAGDELARAQAEQEIVWRTRLGDLLERDPQAAVELRALIAEVDAAVVTSRGQVEQHVAGYDHARQAVQGHGVQVNTFGAPDPPGRR